MSKVRQAIRRHSEKCRYPKGCATCVFGDYLLSPDPSGRKAAEEEIIRVERGRMSVAGGGHG